LAFPVPSSTLPVARRALEVFRSLRDARFYPGVVPSRLWFPSRAPLSCGPALTGLLSWDSSGRTLTRSSPCTAPSSTWPRRVHSHPMSPSGFGSELFLFRPRGFSPPRRFPPRRNVRACCIPLPILEFTAFPAFDRHLLAEAAVVERRVPRDAFTPRRTPATVAVPRHRGRYLLVVPLLSEPSTSRSCSTIGSVMSRQPCR
jgi:hypothetical protein